MTVDLVLPRVNLFLLSNNSMKSCITGETNNCMMTVDLVLPRVNLFLPSKQFYEVLYNR